MSGREEEWGLARWGRQVSEDLDIDHLLADLSPEEVEELENELTMMDLDPSVPVGLRQRNQLEKAPATVHNHGAELDLRYREPKKLFEREFSSQNWISDPRDHCAGSSDRPSRGERRDKDKIKSHKDNEDKVLGKSMERKPQRQVKVFKPKEKSEIVNSNEREKKEQVKKIEKGDKGGQMFKLSRPPQKSGEKKVEQRNVRDMEAHGAISMETVQKEETRLQKNEKDEKKNKGKERLLGESQRLTGYKDPGGTNAYVKIPVEAGEVQAENEESTTKKFKELMEKIRNNDPETFELNVNNSSELKPQTLIQLVKALKENTHVRTLALANTRADDHVACALADILTCNKILNSINLDSNHLTGKGILALINALQDNATVTELRFHNQRHICGGKTEMEMARLLKENITLLKLGYHFQLPGPRMVVNSILSANMDKQRQKRLKDQKQAQADVKNKVPEKKRMKEDSTQIGYPGTSPKSSPQHSKSPSTRITPRQSREGEDGASAAIPEPPPQLPPAPVLNGDLLRNSLKPVSERKQDDQSGGHGLERNLRDQLLASIRNSSVYQLKKVKVPNRL
uniref:Leiomodin 1 n=1 Tax=Scleropages formosus TaxID=113540 RepID=A0A8C9WB08_SCLFO